MDLEGYESGTEILIHLNLYDIEENHWYECYRRIKDFSKLRENGITELLVKAILEKQKPSI